MKFIRETHLLYRYPLSLLAGCLHRLVWLAPGGRSAEEDRVPDGNDLTAESGFGPNYAHLSKALIQRGLRLKAEMIFFRFRCL